MHNAEPLNIRPKRNHGSPPYLKDYQISWGRCYIILPFNDYDLIACKIFDYCRSQKQEIEVLNSCVK